MKRPPARPVSLAAMRWTLLAAVALVFGRALLFEFVAWDDNINLYENVWFRPVRAESLARFWSEAQEQLYIPLTYTVWALLAAAAGWARPAAFAPLPPGLFHAANVVLHAAAVLVLFELLRGAVRRDRAGAAWVGALLFAVHPLQVEPVVWCTGLKDVLSGALALLALWGYARFLAAPRGSPGRAARYAGALAAFALALLAKPSAAALPAMAAVWGLLPAGRPWREVVVSLLPWLGAATAAAWITRRVQPIGAGAPFATPWAQRPLVAADALAFYLGRLVWPLGLGPDYGRVPRRVLDAPWPVHAGAALALAAVAVLLLWPRRRRGYAAGLLMAAAALLPVSGLVPFGYQNISTVADRYAYLALPGAALAATWWLAAPGRRWRRWAAAVALAALTAGAVRQVGHWRDTESLFTRALAVNPRSWTAHNNLAMIAGQAGRYAEARDRAREALRHHPGYPEAHSNLGRALVELGQVEEGLSHHRLALAYRPRYARGHVHLAAALVQSGDREGGERQYRDALAVNPRYPEAHNNLGALLMTRDRAAEAEGHFREALRIRPDYLEAWRNLARTAALAGRTAEAMDHYEQAIRVAPADAASRLEFGRLLEGAGRRAEAIEAFAQAVALEPESFPARMSLAQALQAAGRTAEAEREYREALRRHPDEAAALNNLAWILVTAADPPPADGAEAVRLAERAVELTERRSAVILDTLAAAYAADGRFAEAVETMSALLADDTMELSAEERRTYEEHLDRYRAGRTLRE